MKLNPAMAMVVTKSAEAKENEFRKFKPDEEVDYNDELELSVPYESLVGQPDLKECYSLLSAIRDAEHDGTKIALLGRLEAHARCIAQKLESKTEKQKPELKT